MVSIRRRTTNLQSCQTQLFDQMGAERVLQVQCQTGARKHPRRRDHRRTGFGTGPPRIPLTYCLYRPDAAFFEIDLWTGLSRTKFPLDYEAKSSYRVGFNRGVSITEATIDVINIWARRRRDRTG